MKALNTTTRRRYRQVICLIGVGCLLANGFMGLATPVSDEPQWTQPLAMSTRLIGEAPTVQSQAVFDPNLDCSTITYRQVGQSEMQNGCFTPTAFGMFNADNPTVIFNGTDEALTLTPYIAGQVIVPWPDAGVALALTNHPADGMLLSLYQDIYAHLDEARNSTGTLVSKKVSAAPDIVLRDSAGQQLSVNPETLAFSDGGSWVSAETVTGYFVRINLATLEMLPFAQSYASLGSPGLLASHVAISDDGRFVAIYNKAAEALRVYDLDHCSLDGSHPLYQTCSFYDYEPFVTKQIPNLSYISKLRFMNSGMLQLTVGLSDKTNKVYLLAPQAHITALLDYLALGDSYTSGEGTFDYIAGTDTGDNMCHQSLRAYPALLTAQLFNSSSGHSVACSGAMINDVGSKSSKYSGQVRGGVSLQTLQTSQPATLAAVDANFSPGFVSQQRFVQNYQPAVVTVSVSGDDVGFGDILENCVVPHFYQKTAGNTCFDTYEARQELLQQIDRTMPKLIALYRQLKSESPGSTLYAIGYPQITYDQGSCALNVHLNKVELAFSAEVIDYLDTAIAKAAQDGGATYIDVSQALVGHRLCEASGTQVAMNGVTAGTDAGVLGVEVFGKESYHPNALGQYLLEQAILRQSHNLTTGTGVTLSHVVAPAFLQVPKTGRTTSKRVAVKKLVTSVSRTKHTITLHSRGTATAAKPGSGYQVHLDGPDGPSLGTVIADADGDIDTTVTLPPDTTGEHTVDVTGTDQTGEPVDITEPIFIPITDGDIDGDGIPDGSDSCLTVPNSGVDEDSDGIDDACDPLILLATGQGGNDASGDLQNTAPPGDEPTPTPVVSSEPGLQLLQPSSETTTALAQMSGQITVGVARPVPVKLLPSGAGLGPFVGVAGLRSSHTDTLRTAAVVNKNLMRGHLNVSTAVAVTPFKLAPLALLRLLAIPVLIGLLAAGTKLRKTS